MEEKTLFKYQAEIKRKIKKPSLCNLKIKAKLTSMSEKNEE